MPSESLYLTVKELLNAPTGVDWNSLPTAGGPTADRDAALTTLLKRATGLVDSEVFQKLQATQDQDVQEVGGDRAVYRKDGTFSVFPENFPVRSITNVQFSYDGVSWSSLPWIPLIVRGRRFRLLQPTSWSWSGSGYGPPPGYDGWLQYIYVNGFANALLTAPTNVGAMSIPVDNPTGVFPNDYLTIFDSVAEEDVQVSSSYVANTSPILLAKGTVNAHLSGVRISALPPAVREGTLAFAIDLARQMGATSILALTTGETKVIEQPTLSLSAAKMGLRPYRRWGK